MAAPFDIVTLFDCDNTLLDNDHVVEDLRNHLEQKFGPRNRDRYFEIFEALRMELGYAAIGYTIYPGTAERRPQYEQLRFQRTAHCPLLRWTKGKR